MNASNSLLASLTFHDLARLRGHGSTVPLQRGSIVAEPYKAIEHVLFVESGVLSVTRGETRPDRIEVGMIGREGMFGHVLAQGVDVIPYSVSVQSSGLACRVPSNAFVMLCRESATFQAAMLRYAQAAAVQVAETACANGRGSLSSRLARWLLMMHDRLDGDEIAVTHDAIADALSVRRPGVTSALHVLEGEHLIRATRGSLQVRDRDGLQATALGFYGVAEAEYARLISTAVRK